MVEIRGAERSPKRQRTGRENRRESEVQVRQVPAGGFFGEIACLEEDGTRTANARTREGCLLLLVPKTDFLRMVETHRAPGRKGLVRHLANTVRHNTDSLARLVPPEEYDHGAEAHPTRWQRFAGTAALWAAHWSFAALNLGLWMLWLAADRLQLMKDLPTMNGLNLWVGLTSHYHDNFFVLASQKRSEEKEQSGVGTSNFNGPRPRWNGRINQIHGAINPSPPVPPGDSPRKKPESLFKK